MPLIVDTFNVLHVTGVLPPETAGIDVYGLAELVASSRYARDRVTLVCDGQPRQRRPSVRGRGARPDHGPASTPPASNDRGAFRVRDGGKSDRIGNVVVRYSGVGVEADDLIGTMIERSTAPRRLLVISTDRRVRAMASRRRCAWLSAEDFLRQLAEDAQHGRQRPGPTASAPAVPLAPAEVVRWARELGLRPEDLDLSARDLVEGPIDERRGRPSERPKRKPDGKPGGEPDQPPTHADGEGESARPPAPETSVTETDANSSQSGARRGHGYRPLEEAQHPEEIDPTELERFDLQRWLHDRKVDRDVD